MFGPGSFFCEAVVRLSSNFALSSLSMLLPIAPEDLYTTENKLKGLKRRLTDIRAELITMDCPVVDGVQWRRLLENMGNEVKILELAEGDLRIERAVRRCLRLREAIKKPADDDLFAIENVD